MKTISIVGAGSVGASIAFSLLSKDITPRILLVDIDEAKHRSQVMDLQDASSISRVFIFLTNVN
jgi:L-lactate dehydrogenase